MAILFDGTNNVTSANKKVSYKPPSKVQYNNSATVAARQAEIRRQQLEAQRRAQEAAAARYQAQYQAYLKNKQAYENKQFYANLAMSKPPSQQKPGNPAYLFNNQRYNSQTRYPVTNNLTPTPLIANNYYPEMQRAQNYPNQNVAIPDRWAFGPGAQSYQNNFTAYQKKQQDELALLKQMKIAWQKQVSPSWNFFNQAYGPPVPPASANQPAPAPDYSGGDYGYTYDWPDYTGGGGGGGSYTPPPPEWWVEMVNWRI